jgi:hypothetical protein
MLEDREPFEFVGGAWVVFERYEVADGYIRPSPGAKGRWYDPWEKFREARSGDIKARSANLIDGRPYLSLVRLVERLPSAATPERDREITAWCSQHGLTGIMLAETDMVALAPVVHEPADAASATQKRYFRTNDRWGEFTRKLADTSGQSLPAGVSGRQLPTTNWLHQDFAHSWAKFFPGVPETEWQVYQYPQPGSGEFWLQYAEPVNEFLRAANLLRDALDGLKTPASAKKTSEAEHQRRKRGKFLLDALVFQVSATTELKDDGSLGLQWVSPSLLGSIAMMAMLDLTESRLIRCVVCDTLFPTHSPKAKYCTARCRNTAQKRAHRKKKQAQRA